MAGPTTEAGLVLAIRRVVKRTYPLSWELKVVGSPYQVSGVPDMLLCVEGVLVGIEVKFRRPGESRRHALERVTPQQKAQIREINRAGGIAGVVTSPDEALELVRHGLRKQEIVVEMRVRKDEMRDEMRTNRTTSTDRGPS